MAGKTQQVAPEDLPHAGQAGEIPGEIENAVLFLVEPVATLEHLCHEMRAEIAVLPLIGDIKQQAEQHGAMGIAQLRFPGFKGLQHRLDAVIDRLRHGKLIQRAGEGRPVGLVEAGDHFHDEAFFHKDVKGVAILAEADGGMGIGKSGEKPQNRSHFGEILGQQNGNGKGRGFFS